MTIRVQEAQTASGGGPGVAEPGVTEPGRTSRPTPTRSEREVCRRARRYQYAQQGVQRASQTGGGPGTNAYRAASAGRGQEMTRTPATACPHGLARARGRTLA